MIGLGPYIGREYAHDLVYDICRDALKQKRPLLDLLAEHPEINKHVTRAQLASFCDPMNNLGQAGVMVDRFHQGIRRHPGCISARHAAPQSALMPARLTMSLQVFCSPAMNLA